MEGRFFSIISIAIFLAFFLMVFRASAILVEGTENIVVSSSNTKNLLKLVPQSSIGNFASEDGVLFIENSLNEKTALRIFTTKGSEQSGSLFQIHTTNSLFDTPIFHIVSTSSKGSNADIRIDSPNPDIELIETDQSSPSGKFEISLNDKLLKIGSRNSQDSSFEIGYIFQSIADGGSMGIGINGNPLAKLHIGFNTDSITQNALLIDNKKNSPDARLGLAWRNTAGQLYNARISAKTGTNNENSTFYIEVANSNKQLMSRLEIDVNGDVYIDSLKGVGEAFVCVNAEGKLYRSDSLCA